jgi:hypothetical protein
MEKQEYIDIAEQELLHTYNRFQITARAYISMIQTERPTLISPRASRFQVSVTVIKNIPRLLKIRWIS